MRVVLVAVSGALGAEARYGVGLWLGVQSFPWATLSINVAGSFALGFVLVFGGARWDRDVVVAVGVGFLGAFTTFSTFSYEAQALLRTERVGACAAYVALSLAGGIAAAALGYALGTAAAR